MKTEIEYKDAKIQTLVDYLLGKYGEESFTIKDYWDGDDAVVGLADVSGKHMVYVSTFGLEEGKFFVELQNLIDPNEMPYESAGEFEDIELEKLEKLFVQHLRLN